MIRLKGLLLLWACTFSTIAFSAPSPIKSLEDYLTKTLRVEEPERFLLNLRIKKQLELGLGSSAAAFNSDGTLTEVGRKALLEKFSPLSADALEVLFKTLGRTEYPNNMVIGPSGSGKSFTFNQFVILLAFGVVPEFLEHELGLKDNDSPLLALLREHFIGKTQIMKINYDLLSRDNTQSGAAFAKAEVRMRAILIDLCEVAKKEFRATGKRTVFLIEEAATLPDLVQQTLKDQLDETGFKAHSKKPAELGSEVGYSIIGLTTPSEYRQMIHADSAIERRYVKMYILEPSEEDVFKILAQKRVEWTELHGLEITDETLIYLISMRKFFGRPPLAMPDSVLKVVGNLLLWAAKPENRKHGKTITVDEAYEFLVRHNHLPPEMWLRDKDGHPPLWNLEQKLNEVVIAQKDAVRIVSQRLKAGRPTGFREVPVFFILGPTGAGKDTLAKAVNQIVFGHNGSHLKFDVAGAQNAGLRAILEGPSIGSASDRELPLLAKALDESDRPNGLIVLNEGKDMPSEQFNMLKVVVEDGVIRPRGLDTRERPLGLNAIFIMGQWGEELFEGKTDAEIAHLVATLSEDQLIKILQNGANNKKTGAVPKALIDRAIRTGGLILMPPVPKTNYPEIVRLNLGSIVEEYRKLSNIELTIDPSLVDLISKIAVENGMNLRLLDGLISDLTKIAITSAIDQGLPERGILSRLQIHLKAINGSRVEVSHLENGKVIQNYSFTTRELIHTRCQTILESNGE